MTLYLREATFIDWRSLDVRRGHLRVEGGSAGSVAFVADVPRHLPDGSVAEVLDCSGRLVTKSFAIGHHHVYSVLARGMPPPAAAPRNFVEILERIWWHVDKNLDAAMIRASALAAGIDAALCGATFLIDHHASPRAALDSLHVIAAALDEIGLGHLLCYELSDRDGPECLQAGVAETEAYLRQRPGLVGLHASFTVSAPLLERAVRLARDCKTGVHVHVAEAESDQEHCRATYGVRVVERLRHAGALDLPQTLLAHCLHVDDAERALICNGKAWVVQNTESNQNNNVGCFDPRGLGDRLLLGTDGMHSDMLAATRSTYLAGQATGGLSPLAAYRRLRRVHDYLSSNGFPGDGDNNLVVLDYHTPTPVTASNWPAHVVYALQSAAVDSVIAQGRLIVHNRRLTTVDAAAARAHAREQAERLWARL